MKPRRKPFGLVQRAASNSLWMMEQLAGPSLGNKLLRQPRGALRERLVEALASQGSGSRTPVDRRRDLSTKEFIREYFLPSKPVVLEGAAAHWPCIDKWSLDYFAEHYGDDDAMVTRDSDDPEIPLRDVIAEMKAGNGKAARICNLIQNHEELRADARFEELDRYMGRARFITSYQFFIGGGGNATPIHAGLTNNFSVQIYGQKRWLLIDPAFNPVMDTRVEHRPVVCCNVDPTAPEAYPEVAYIDVHEALLGPGDILFNPSFWWHHVSYVTDSVTIGARWLSPYSVLRSSPMLGLIVATTPSTLKSYLTHATGKTGKFYN